jgi:predicted transposase/invertase (TIGR01784 family)
MRNYGRYFFNICIKSELDYQSGMVEARRKIRAEGRAEGRAETSLEITRNLLGKGLTIDFIHETTGLDIETIEQLAGSNEQ